MIHWSVSHGARTRTTTWGLRLRVGMTECNTSARIYRFEVSGIIIAYPDSGTRSIRFKTVSHAKRYLERYWKHKKGRPEPLVVGRYQ